MILSDLREIKKILEIENGDTSEDAKLNFFIEYASQWIEEVLDRPGMSWKSRTEYYKGTGTQKLLLKSRPVFTTPTIQVFIDEAGYYGAPADSFSTTPPTLVYGEDFALQIDQEDGSSRSGILLRMNNLWPKPTVRQTGLLSPFIGEGFGTIKVIYTAGYTVDMLPAGIRLACNLLVSRLRYIFPLGIELNSEGYEERSIGIVTSEKEKLLTLVKPLILPYKNWRW